jgi:hypothetical protein
VSLFRRSPFAPVSLIRPVTHDCETSPSGRNPMGRRRASSPPSRREEAAMTPHANAAPIGLLYASGGRESTVLWGYSVPAPLRVLGMSLTGRLLE